MSFLKRLFEMAVGETARQTPTPPIPPAPLARRTPTQPPLPAPMRSEYLDWFKVQRKPAVTVITDPELTIEPGRSRVFGPAFLQTVAAWPVDATGDFSRVIYSWDCS